MKIRTIITLALFGVALVLAGFTAVAGQYDGRSVAAVVLVVLGVHVGRGGRA